MQWYRVHLTQALQGQLVCWVLGDYSGLVKMMPWAMSNVLAWTLVLCAQVHKKGGVIHLPCPIGGALRYAGVQDGGCAGRARGRQLPSVESAAPEMSEKWNTDFWEAHPQVSAKLMTFLAMADEFEREAINSLKSLCAGRSAWAALKEPHFRGSFPCSAAHPECSL